MPEAFAKKIEKQDKILIKAAVSSLNDLNLQKKAFMSLVASNVLCDYLREQQITIISENNGFSGILLLKDFDIANITVENNVKIAVRAFVGDDYPKMCIPRSHFLNNILADIYVGIRLETKIDKAEFVGFIEVDKINRQTGNDKYISIEVNNLKSIDELKQTINASGKRKNSHFALDHEKAKELFFQYIESRISTSDKEFFARHISSCPQCSQEFNHIVELDNIIKANGNKFDFEEIQENNEDYTLKLFAEDPDLLGEEVKINLEEKVEKIINNKESRQKKNIYGRNLGKAVNTAGKLALLSGAVLGGGHVVSAIQAAKLSGLVGTAALEMTAASVKGISEGLSSVAENFNDTTLSNGNQSFNNKFESFDSNLEESSSSNNFDSQEEVNSINSEIVDKFEFNSDEVENIQDSASFEEVNSINSEIVDKFEFNSDEVENIQDLDSIEETDMFNGEIPENAESAGEFLKETQSFDELPAIEENILIREELTEVLPDLHSSSSEILNTSSLDESLIIDENAESIVLSEDLPEVDTGFIEVQHKDLSQENFSSNKENDLQAAFDDIAIDYNIDDLLSSFDTVEVVDSSSDFFDFESSETPAKQEENLEFISQETIKPDKEQTENLITDIYGDQNDIIEEQNLNQVPENIDKPKQISYEIEDAFDCDFDDEEQDETDLKKEKLRSIDIKLASGLAAAGIAVTVAVALWINNKTLTNQNLPVTNPQPVNQTTSVPKPTDINNQNPNNTAPPVDSAANQPTNPTPVRHREPLHTYTKQVKSSDIKPPGKDLSAVLAEAFTRRTYEVDIRNISWEITADMARNPVFKNYIMVTGQALKSALARDLSLADERALNTQMEIKTVMDLNGNILEATVVQSSGSKEVDKICLDTYKTTIQFTKLPKINVNRDKIKANLIISF